MDFTGRKLAIATMHGKEAVIAPLLEKHLGVICLVPQNLDTDQLGTFSGEVERCDDPLTTARKKCLLGMERSGSDLAVASEGSFGPHPNIPFVPADDECLVFIDQANNLEIIARKISTDTNFNGRKVHTLTELHTFAREAGFPSHGLILRQSKDDIQGMVKGIRDQQTLHAVFEKISREAGSAYVETDMRAMHNPKRLKVIEQAAEALIRKILHDCPACHRPGWDITDVQRGLPCSLCQLPTNSVLSVCYTCAGCGFSSVQTYPDGKESEDPMFCDFCNP